MNNVRKMKVGLVFLILMVTGFNFFLYSQNSSQKDSQIIEYLEFREVDIKDVLRQLAKQYNLNIIFSENIKGLITVQLQNVSVEEVLDAIVTTNGYVYTKKGNIYKITTPEEAEKEGRITRIFKLNNADANKLKESLKKVLSKDGTIEVDIRSNSLIITDTPSIMGKVEKILPKLDEPTPQVLIEARFIETTLEATQKLGIDWQITATATGPARPTTFPFKALGDKKLKDISPLGKPDNFPAPNYGFPYVDSIGEVGESFSFGTLSLAEFQAVLDFLMTKSNAKILSSPRIVTLDNKEAKIQVGETRYIRTGETYNEDTHQREYTYEEKELGVILTVTPHVTPSGHIKLILKPEVSSFKGYDENSYPVITTRNAETEVLIKDGQTIVIGGLVKNEKTVSYTKIPFLGDLPLVGWFFTHKEVNPNTKTNLLIFVTARIVKGDKEKLLAYKSDIVTSPPRDFKLKLREIKLK